MVSPNLRDAHEREEEDDWSSDWEEHLSELAESQQTGFPFNPFTTNRDSDDMPAPTLSFPSFPPGASPTDKEAFKSALQAFRSGFQTSTTTVGPYSEQAGPTSTPTQISNSGPAPTTTDADGFGKSTPAETHQKGSSNHGAMYAAAAIVPVVVIAILAVLAFFYLRKRRRQRNAAAGGASPAQMREMKSRNQPVVAARYASNPPSPPPAAQPQYAAPPSSPPPPASPVAPQPVILGPIGASSNGAYFTGIDTSDVASMNERTGLGDPFADGNSIQEEPPPPYRPSSLPPTSIAPSSRQSSLRHPPTAAQSTTHLIPTSQPTERSPFADPDDDDNVSELSGPTLRRHHDGMSVVSDLSYQEEPVVVRPSV